MTAETIAKALRGRKVGQGWVACCPAHDDRKPSLSIRDVSGKVLVRCHAGCDQRDLIAILNELGLWDGKERSTLGRLRHRKVSPPRPDPDHVERSAVALSIWKSTVPADGTPVDAYLASRGLTHLLPPSLRFHPGLKHPQGGIWPCMVALVKRGVDDTPLAIHRTFLARKGSAKAPVKPAKMMLGPCRGGAVRLAEPTEILMVGEGIETCLAAMQATGHSAWAALSTSGLRALDLPECVRHVIVLADGDDPGEAAARDCALRWMRQGRRVRIARPPRGLDFNDMLLGRAPGIEEGAR
ncbi:MAG: toprim domain-containing protein [Nitratireductor sp.]